ncbi:1,4-alpha-glucan branching protein GlgB [Roseospira marina]|uniref:1,4-alpha-glucan branching enzyme GlgB n=1 Tax=Roseospira marina TaxID=140057 RepID=A0A5M6IFK6_9PROT|nr:1,4-alpha-glucan branching protein GlgB [Roseospira marina]KAA5607080.1 1,4-alpha-glucan branching protein GlgB [Roseospira marina]MBB4312727.1 1,4-alpha-glucan branching enzyme [Roseospira marina]MBB5086500.1 1,4-alpha-glucan branching enzyme [Roseospira marina]
MLTSPIADSVRAIVEARHGDPFAFLGPHAGSADGTDAKGRCVRALLPWATAVTLIDPENGSVLGEATKTHEAGLFVADFPEAQDAVPYKLRVTGPDGPIDLWDPYSFPPVLGELDTYFIGEGTHLKLYEKMGAHMATLAGVRGVAFTVWAPNARRVSVVGDFNGWDGRQHTMRKHPNCGVWEIFLPEVPSGTRYKYEILGADGNLMPLKADPYAFYAEVPPATASVVWDLAEYPWSDDAWMDRRAKTVDRSAPISVYEVHIGSWKHVTDAETGASRPMTYRELAAELPAYVRRMGFTHIELLPVNEHPFDGSWGYQPIGLFAPTSRFGTPDDFRYFVNRCHEEGIGIIVDWVAGHFPEDAHGLVWFDGTHLYEHADPRQGRHMDWGTLIYNYGRTEVRNFLLANALFWLDKFHIDGLRVDAVASMLYLDYSREADDWIPNKFGGRENLEAIDFIRRMNELVYGQFPGAITLAEESTAWPMVSRPTYLGGLGFGYKWNMGWMNDTLSYIGEDPIHRQYHHNELTFSLIYAFNENFMLPLSHDEVVHGKRSILGRMPGDCWQQFANMRAYLAYMWTHPGKKLIFMGTEFAQGREWNYQSSLDWHLLDIDYHKQMQDMVAALNALYRDTPALHANDCESDGFSWIDCTDYQNSVIAYMRRESAEPDAPFVVVVCNLTPIVREDYRIGAPRAGWYEEILNTDDAAFGGSGVTNGRVVALPQEAHGHAQSLLLNLPPLATVVLKPVGES